EGGYRRVLVWPGQSLAHTIEWLSDNGSSYVAGDTCSFARETWTARSPYLCPTNRGATIPQTFRLQIRGAFAWVVADKWAFLKTAACSKHRCHPASKSTASQGMSKADTATALNAKQETFGRELH